MNTFQELNLPEALQEALKRMDYHKPTEIQAQAIPLAMAGHDILGSAQTGTGKTAAFSIPLINKLIEDPSATALVLTPTRELAEQVIAVLHQLLNKRRDIKTALLIGGVAIGKQFLRLKDNPRIIVGTPGRINDHLDRRSINFKNNRILVLDEADRMLDMGFGVQLEAIAKHLPTERQTFMFSATIPKRILSLSEKFLNKPQRIKIGATHAPLAKIKQDIVRTTEDGKYFNLLKELDKRTGSIIIFAKTKRKVDTLANKLKEKMGAAAMHGDLRQHQRTRIIKEFREQKYRILVATDVAARGLDIPHIEHVINYDLPQAPEDYIHRIGRTARGDAEGSALCFISREDEKYWRAIERLLGGDESGPSMQRAANSFKPKSSSRPKPKFGAREYDSRSSGAKPRSKSRFSDSDSRAGAKTGSRSSDARPGSRSRFSDNENSRSDARPASRGRFSDSGSSRSDERPASRGRFADSGSSRSDSRPASRSRFADNGSSRSDERPASRGRFSDNGSSRSDERPASRGRFSDSGSSRSDARPASRGRFSDNGNSRSDSRPASRDRFANGETRSDSRPPSRDRFANGDSRSDARPASRSRFSDNGNSRSDSRPASRSRFSDETRSSARPASRTRSAEGERATAKPASKRPNPPKRNYGPQNRPAKAKKSFEESYLN